MAEVIGFKTNPKWDGQNAGLLTEIGDAFEKGTIFERNYPAAIYFYTLAAENGSTLAIKALNSIREAVSNSGRDKEVIRFKISAEWDGQNAGLLVKIGYDFEKGTIFERNYPAAIYFYTLAADNGNALAINNLGWMHETGIGFEQNVELAVDYFKDAAALGCTTAMVNLGNVFQMGLLTGEPDYDEAFKWYKRASDHDDLSGTYNYANCFHWGWGTPVDHEKAFMMFSDLYEAGYDGTEFYLGLYYQEGLSVEINYALARKYYEEGAQKNDMYCNNQLGVMFAKGLGVEKNPQKALDYYKRAAELGDALAYTNVGWMYESGDLGEVDKDTAAYWYARGSQVGKQSPRDHLMKGEMAFYDDVMGGEPA